MRKWVKIAVVALVITMLAGTLVTASAVQPKLTLMIWAAGDEDVWLPIVADFNKTNGVEIELLSVDNSQYDQKLTTMRAGGVAPDVFMVRFDYYPTDAATGQLLDVTRYVEKDSELLRAMLPQDKLRSMIDGHWWGLGFKYAFAHAYYNRNAFAESGVQPMPIDGAKAWSWDTFVNSLKKLVRTGSDDKITQYGVGFPIHWLRVGSMLKTWGVDFVKADGFDLGSPAAMNAMEGIKDLFDRRLTVSAKDNGQSRNWFAGRKVGILFEIDTAPHKALMGTTNDYSWYGVAAYPAGPGRTAGTSYMFGENLAVSSQTKYPDLAYKLLSFAVMRQWNLRSEVPYLYQYRQLHPDEKALAFQYAFPHTDVLKPFVGFAQQGKLNIGGTMNKVFAGTMPISQLNDYQKQLDKAVAEERFGVYGK